MSHSASPTPGRAERPGRRVPLFRTPLSPPPREPRVGAPPQGGRAGTEGRLLPPAPGGGGAARLPWHAARRAVLPVLHMLSSERGGSQPLALLVRGALCLSAGVWGGGAAEGGRRPCPGAGGSAHGARRSPGDARRPGLLQYVLGPLELSVGRQGHGHRIIVTVLMKGFKLAW